MPKVYVFYHFFYPDDVVSSIHISDLCSGLADSGWEVTVFPSTRGCRNESNTYPHIENWNGVKIRRIWRPAWKQASGAGRILNAVYMIFRWALMAPQNKHRPDVIIIGTDPVLSILIALVWRYFQPSIRIAHWCFDLYPEAAYADGALDPKGLAARVLRRILQIAYGKCDLVVDIGHCMRDHLLSYEPSLRTATLVPWALIEPQQALPIAQSERDLIFGSVHLGLMYSGNFGRAHSSRDMLELARLLREDGVHLIFSVRGNRAVTLKAAAMPNDCNIHFVPFATIGQLENRLAAADIHIVSLREEWTGTVVPSKFFGALAIGRPVLFCGSSQSMIAKWIEQYSLGWVLAPGNVEQVANSLQIFSSDPHKMEAMRIRCHSIYQQQFSRKITLAAWNKQLLDLLEPV